LYNPASRIARNSDPYCPFKASDIIASSWGG